MRKLSQVLLYICGITTLVAGGVAIAAAGDDERHVKVHVIESSSDCEGNDCDESVSSHRKIIIKCLGDGCKESEIAKHVVIEKGGKLTVVGENGLHWISSDSDDSNHHFNFDFRGLHSSKGGFLGVELNELSPELKAHFGVPDDLGVMVSKVLPDSPASKAGIQVGDIISGLNGEDITSAGKLAREVRSRDEGETVNLEVWRDGKLETLSAGIEVRDVSSVLPRGFAFHGKHGGDKKIEIRRLHGDHDDFDFDCGDSDECRVIVECHDGSCECTVNGDSADCDTIPGVSHQSD